MTRTLHSFPAGSEETPHPDPQCNTTLYWSAPATLFQLAPQLHWERNVSLRIKFGEFFLQRNYFIPNVCFFFSIVNGHM